MCFELAALVVRPKPSAPGRPGIGDMTGLFCAMIAGGVSPSLLTEISLLKWQICTARLDAVRGDECI